MNKIYSCIFTIILTFTTLNAQQVVYLDFGNTATSGNYNTSITYSPALNLIDFTGKATGINLIWTKAFVNSIITGATTTTGDAKTAFPDGNTTKDGIFLGNNTSTSFELQNLDPTKKYSFTIFGSILSVYDVRSARYTITGTTTVKDSLNASNNTSNVVTIKNIAPLDKKITFTTQAATTNTSSSKFYYLNAIKIDIDNVSGINSLNNMQQIYYKNRSIIVTNYNGVATIYNLAGKMIDSLKFENGHSAITLTNGIYFLRTDQGSYKLIVSDINK